MTITKSSSLLLLAIVLLLAFLDYQSWILEQVYLLDLIPIQTIFTVQAILYGVLAILIYKQVRSYLGSIEMKESNLSDREKEVLQEILSGKSNRVIEETLFIEKSTLKSHINRIYKKLNVSSRQELIDRYSAS